MSPLTVVPHWSIWVRVHFTIFISLLLRNQNNIVQFMYTLQAEVNNNLIKKKNIMNIFTNTILLQNITSYLRPPEFFQSQCPSCIFLITNQLRDKYANKAFLRMYFNQPDDEKSQVVTTLGSCGRFWIMCNLLSQFIMLVARKMYHVDDLVV